MAALQCGERIVMLLHAANPEVSLRFPEVLLSLRSPTAQSALRTHLGWHTGMEPDVAVVMREFLCLCIYKFTPKISAVAVTILFHGSSCGMVQV